MKEKTVHSDNFDACEVIAKNITAKDVRWILQQIELLIVEDEKLIDKQARLLLFMQEIADR